MGAAAENSSLEGIFGERWQALERVGHGAMGEVWRGRHALLGHEVAIKLMRPEAARDRNLVARFKREARIAAQLRHRNLVRVEDFGITGDGRPYLVMEFLRGRTLGAFLETQRPSHATVLRVVQQIGAALDAAHAEGIVHRDLKPDNCFVVDDDEGLHVKVLDFGVAKVTDGMFVTANGVVTAAHALLGTPMYMSPEQARGDADVDRRSDLWSLGVMTFEMLTGRMPFDAPTVSQVLLQVLNAQVPSASGFDPTLPISVDAWFARALGREKNQRFQTGRELSTALASALGLAPASYSSPSLQPLAANDAAGVALHTVQGLGPTVTASLPPTSMIPQVSHAAVLSSSAASQGPHAAGGSGLHPFVAASSAHGSTGPVSSAHLHSLSSPGGVVLSRAPSSSTHGAAGMFVALAVAAVFALGMGAVAVLRVRARAIETTRAALELPSVPLEPRAIAIPSVPVPPGALLVPTVPAIPAIPSVPSSVASTAAVAAPAVGSATPTAASVTAISLRTPGAVPLVAGRGRGGRVTAAPSAGGDDTPRAQGSSTPVGFGATPRPSAGEYSPDTL